MKEPTNMPHDPTPPENSRAFFDPVVLRKKVFENANVWEFANIQSSYKAGNSIYSPLIKI